ncbi:MAG: hypothetical protein ABI210_00605 [Abditibacteriaceae bacterium]
MSNSQKPEDENLASTGGVPSPPLPKFSSPAIPDINGSLNKTKYAKEKPTPTDSFQLAGSIAKTQAEKDTEANVATESAPTSHKAADNSPQNIEKKTESSTTSSHQELLIPHKVAPQLASHAPTGKPVPAPIRSPELDKALEHRRLSKEEKEKLDNTAPKTEWQKFLEFLQPIALWLVSVSIFFAAISSVFLILNFFHGNLSPSSPLANSGDFLHAVSLASLTLELSTVVLACCLILLWFDATVVAFSILAIGLILYFGTPLLLFNEIGRSQATGIITLPLRQAGLVMIVLGLFKYCVDVVFWIRTLPERMQARADLGAAQNEKMISQIIRGELPAVIKSPTWTGHQSKKPRGPWYINLGDQAHKSQLLSLLAVPGTVIAVYLLWPIYTKLFIGFSHYLDKLWDLISYNPHKLATGVLKANSPQDYKNLNGMDPAQLTHAALVIFGVLLGFLLLTYILKFIEWAINETK